MTSGGSHITFAKALYKVASKKDVAERVFGDLGMLLFGQSVGYQPALISLLKRVAYLKKDQQKKVLKEALKGKVHELTLNLLILLSASKKFRLLPRIMEVYGQLHHEAKGITQLKVCTARDLKEDEAAELIRKLEAACKKKIRVKFEVKKDLIGGVQIYERGFVTDYSVKNYLDTLKRSLLST